MDSILEIDRLQTVFGAGLDTVTAVEEVTLALQPGETLCLVGESGSGKSVTALSVMRLLGSGGRISGGEIRFGGRDLAGLPETEMRRIRGREMAMVFQEPMSSLNPVLTIGSQLTEMIRLHTERSGREAKAYAVRMLEKVGLPRAADVIKAYPYMLSGGMRQRIMIAMALSCSPKLLIADEPTTALDVTVQAQILELMKELRNETGTAILLITHDLGVVAEMADKVAIMYAGQIVEEADVFTLFRQPLHPYTKGLLDSIVRLEDDGGRLTPVPGTVPPLHRMPQGCRFHTRCAFAEERCRREPPELKRAEPGHSVRCWLAGEQAASPLSSRLQAVGS
ncbi:ABC transporter ATP-binding protein [Paenibacillus caseinilyticus]|uniref:ABC transporter ATP-binding protein n=1 Tax=Paenibacillus caseinilyticus TaxID=3098138 RepID=UPI0022B8B2E0|nr:ABC transporter ATP-binding protein [Paenibacillus caseinilyticus]MCZ8521684.1 ABC transporter ATP-binding protein [Paenibacillus caseinilyticus]